MSLFLSECGNCGSKEHSTGDCPHGLLSSECAHCGSKNHATNNCPHGLFSSKCASCGSTDHSTDHCPHGLLSSKCGHCESSNHSTNECPHGLLSSKCGNCGSTDHATSECPHAFYGSRGDSSSRSNVSSPNKYDEPSPTYSSSSSGGDDGVTALFGFLAFIAAAIAVLLAILAVIASIPIWLGATAVAVIAAYFQSRKVVARIPAEMLAAAPVIQSWTKKRLWRKSTSKLHVDPAFLKQHIRWNPDLLTTTGVALAYAAVAGGLLVVVNEQQLVRIMFGVPVLGSIYLAWKSSRRMIEWKLAERVYAARQMPPGSATSLPQVAFVFSVVVFAILVVLLIGTALTLPRQLQQRRSRLATAPVEQPRLAPQRSGTQTTQPRPRIEKPAPPRSTVVPRQPLVTSPPAANTAPGVAASTSQGASTALPPAVSADAISDFVTQLMELEKSHQLDSILSKYASRVAYFDNGVVDHAFIRKDKADYYARWPSISYALNGAINATQVGSNVWEVRAPTKFHVTNQRGEWIDGDVTQALTIDTSGPSWLITAEKGEVTRREKGTGLPPTESSASAASSGSSQAIGGGAFRGKGTVYKIPDLKSLVGKQLSNAWLYGEFAFEQQQGNVAVCRTAATVLFVGKGTTKVNIEFAGGFSVSDRILASMRDPQLPLTFTLRTAPNNPMRLLRIRQNRDGTLEAFARSPIRLDMQ